MDSPATSEVLCVPNAMPRTLIGDAYRAALWSYAGTFVYALLQFGGNITYARLLGPQAVGVFALSLLVSGPLKLLSDMGYQTTLIQRRDLTDHEIGTVLASLLSYGVVACIALFVFAGPVSRLMGSADLAGLLQILSLTFLFYPVSAICSSLLSRNLNQRYIQAASVAGYLLGYLGVGLGCAMLGYGGKSLAIGFTAQVIVWTVVMYLAARPEIRPRFQRPAPDIARFSHRVLLTNLSSWTILNTDNLFVSRFFGAVSLGYYSVAYNLVRTPLEHLVGGMQSVLLPATSRTQHDRQKISTGYLAALEAVGTVTLPAFATVAVLSGPVVLALYGPRWMDAAVLLRPLAVAMPFQALAIVSSTILIGVGAVGKELRIQWYSTLLFVVVVVTLAYRSIEAMAWGIPLIYSVRAVWLARSAARSLDVSIWRVLRTQCFGTSMTLAMVVAASTLDRLSYLLDQPRLRLGLVLGCQLMLWISVVAALGPRFLMPELARVIRSGQNAATSLLRRPFPFSNR